MGNALLMIHLRQVLVLWPHCENFLEIKVEEVLNFLSAQITLKYSKKRRETVAVPLGFRPKSPC